MDELMDERMDERMDIFKCFEMFVVRFQSLSYPYPVQAWRKRTSNQQKKQKKYCWIFEISDEGFFELWI